MYQIVKFINFISKWSTMSIFVLCLSLYKEWKGHHDDANMYFILVFVFVAIGKLDDIRKKLGCG